MQMLEAAVCGQWKGTSSFIVNVDVHGPSLMVNALKGALALSTRARLMANIIDVLPLLVNPPNLKLN